MKIKDTRSKKYTAADRAWVADDVLDSVASGKSVHAACKTAGVSSATFKRWISEDAELKARFEAARAEGIEQMASEILEIADTEPNLIADEKGARYDSAHINWHKLRISSRQWLLSKLVPNQYGDRLALAGDQEAPVAVVIRGDDADL